MTEATATPVEGGSNPTSQEQLNPNHAGMTLFQHLETPALPISGYVKLFATSAGLFLVDYLGNITQIGEAIEGGYVPLQPTSNITINDNGGDFDIAIEGDTDPMLFYLNAGIDAIGIGTDYPYAKLHIVGFTAHGNDPVLMVQLGIEEQLVDIFQIVNTHDIPVAGFNKRGVLFSHGNSPLSNIFIGSEAGNTEDMTGNYNIVIGNYAGQNITNSTYNTIVGYIAGNKISTNHHYNTILGYAAGYKVAAGGNTLIGYLAGTAIESGNNNIMIGKQAGSKQTTNSDLFIIDNRGRASAAEELTNSIIYGVMAAAAADQSLRLNANVGIGLTPTANMPGLSVEAGLLTLKETTTPTADDSYGKIYTKSDNKLYFQDGAGVEHEVALVA